MLNSIYVQIAYTECHANRAVHFLIFGALILFMMTTNLFVIANVKQLRTGGSFRILLFFFPNILGFWRPKFSSF